MSIDSEQRAKEQHERTRAEIKHHSGVAYLAARKPDGRYTVMARLLHQVDELQDEKKQLAEGHYARARVRHDAHLRKVYGNVMSVSSERTLEVLVEKCPEYAKIRDRIHEAQDVRES